VRAGESFGRRRGERQAGEAAAHRLRDLLLVPRHGPRDQAARRPAEEAALAMPARRGRHRARKGAAGAARLHE